MSDEKKVLSEILELLKSQLSDDDVKISVHAIDMSSLGDALHRMMHKKQIESVIDTCSEMLAMAASMSVPRQEVMARWPDDADGFTDHVDGWVKSQLREIKDKALERTPLQGVDDHDCDKLHDLLKDCLWFTAARVKNVIANGLPLPPKPADPEAN